MLIHHIPDALHNPDLADLIKSCKQYVEKYGVDSPNGDLNHDHFRSVMCAIFGKDALKVISHLTIQPPTPPPQVPPKESSNDD